MKSILTNLRIEFATKMSGLILDCGNGEGIYRQYLKGDVIQLDIDINELKKLEGHRVLASVHKLPFKNDVFDSIWGCAIIEHVKEDCIQELIRVSKRGGQLAILTPNRLSPIDIFRRLIKITNWYSYEGHVRLYSVGEIEKYGDVYGEVSFIPFLDKFFRLFPRLSHSIMLYIKK